MFIIKNIQAFGFPSYYQSFIFIIIIFIITVIFILYFLYYIFYLRLKKNNNTNLIQYNSLIKDKEFILFKNNLLNLYYSILTIFFIYLFKNNYFNLLLDFNIHLIYFINTFFIFNFTILLINNNFILKLFNLFNLLKKNINLFNEINWISFSLSQSFVNNNLKINKFKGVRNYSTFSENIEKLSDDNSNETKNKYKKTNREGYLGYNTVHNLGNVAYMINSTEPYFVELCINDLSQGLKLYLNDLPENTTFSVLPVLRWQLFNGDVKSITISNSIKLTRFTNSSLLAERIFYSLHNALIVYLIDAKEIDLLLLSRAWLNVNEFNAQMPEINTTLDDLIEKETSHLSKFSVRDQTKLSEKANKLKNYLYKNIIMDNYGDPVYNKSNNLIGYKLKDNKYASVQTYYNENNLLCNKVEIKDFDLTELSFKGETLISWVDIKLHNGFVREFNKNKYFYDNNNKLINVETEFNCSSFPLRKKDTELNEKIGSIDFETFGSDSGSGYQQVYSGGWAIKGKTKLFYIRHNESSEQFVNRLFFSILMSKSLNEYTFYLHNLGRFDAVFIIKSLILLENVSIVPIWKDNAILSLTISYLGTKIILLDSLQLIPGSLGDILKSFNCVNKKGLFPYSFVNKNNLFYVGQKPLISYYKDISDQEYLSIPEQNWNLEQETLDYLRSDVEGLLEVILNFNKIIFDKYSLNITKHKTLSGLALAVYGSSYIPNYLIKELKMIKGELEREIRSAYFGGNVDVYINEVTNAYLYDMNSQYPEAMLKDMPVGDPVLSLENNLDKIFGFVYGEISCPNESSLQNPFIQYRDPLTNIVTCPRGKFSRLIFSQEIKYALKYGYSINIEYCYQFKREKNLFTKYVTDHYEIKNTASDPIQKAIAKLFLNSLYGRMGMKDIEHIIKIVDKNEAENLDKVNNVSVLSKLTDNKYLVKYSGQLNDNLRKLYSKESIGLEKNKTVKYSKLELKSSGINKKVNIPSAVHIAAAISSYARISINEFKNIPGNPCIMSDTDSAVLPYALPDHLVGSGIGQMKLVHKIKSGIFIKKKIYCIIDYDNHEIIKSSGIDSSKLNYESFIKLLNGGSVWVERNKFNVDWKNLDLTVVNSHILVQGLTTKIKTIFNTTDVNYKVISFPIKYNLIIHPMFPYFEPVVKFRKTVKIKPEIITKESDFFLIFSKFEIILFFLFFFLSVFL